MQKQRYTIRDIAKLANVSRGTVDRVIHERGVVSDEARKKVKEVLEQINYEPNLIARSLKAHKNNIIAVIIPDYSEDNYWRQCVYGIRKAEKEYRQFGISLQYFEYGNTRQQYEEQFNAAIAAQPDASLVVPMYYEDSLGLFEKMEAAKIPFGLINTPIENIGNKTFIGQDYIKSGRVAAQLMDTLIAPGKKVLIVHVEKDFENSTHLHQKEEGFIAYFQEKKTFDEIEILKFADAKDLNRIKEILPEASGVFMTSSQTHLIAEILEDNSDIKVVGYDLIPANVKYLKSGQINMLIHQNPNLQGYNGITSLSDFLLYKKEMPKTVYLPLDIVMSENLDCYL